MTTKPSGDPLPADAPSPKKKIPADPDVKDDKEVPPEETTRVLLTGDNRTVVTEDWVPTAAYGFRIYLHGQWWEHISEAVDSGTWIFAPTR